MFIRCRECRSCSSPTTDMWLKGCLMLTEHQRAVNNRANLYLKSIRNIFENFYPVFFTSAFKLAELRWVKSTAPRSLAPIKFSKLLALISRKRKATSPRKSLQNWKRSVPACWNWSILMAMIDQFSTDFDEEQDQSGRAGWDSCGHAKTVCLWWGNCCPNTEFLHFLAALAAL